MNFDNPKIKKWLVQFDENDIGLAKSFLNYLKFISNNEFENRLYELLTEIKNEVGNNKIAVIPLNDEPKLTDISNGSEVVKSKRYHYNSADRVGQYLTNIERIDPKSFVNFPTTSSMRAERIKNIVLVDDIAGSGRRVINFCKHTLNKSIKSWVSFKYTKLWLVLYAATEEALENIFSEVKFINENNVKVFLNIRKPLYLKNDFFITFLLKYGSRTGNPYAYLGYKDTCSSIIFQHGCPNTSPSILWSKSKHWSALFPSQGIPTELVELFNDKKNTIHESEILWKINQRKLALKLLEASNISELDDDETLIVTVLSLIQKNYPIEEFYKLMLQPKKKIKEIIFKCTKFELIKDNSLTDFGKDIINRSKLFRKKVNKNILFDEKKIGNYFPSSLNGFQRNSSE